MSSVAVSQCACQELTRLLMHDGPLLWDLYLWLHTGVIPRLLQEQELQGRADRKRRILESLNLPEDTEGDVHAQAMGQAGEEM